MKSAGAAWCFVAPALVIIGLFFIVPVIAALAMSLTDFDIYALADRGNLRLVGLRNYVQLLQTPLFWKALGNTLYFVVVGVPLSIGVSFGTALLLHSKVTRFQAVFRTALFAPVVTTLVAVAVIWRYLLHPHYGLLNYGLSRLGLPPIDWLGDPSWAMPAIILLAVWKNFGYNMVIFLVGLQSIPEPLYESGTHRRGIGLAAVPPHHPADPRAHRHHGQRPDHRRLLPALRRAVRHDAGRPSAEHGQRALLHVRGRLPSGGTWARPRPWHSCCSC